MLTELKQNLADLKIWSWVYSPNTTKKTPEINTHLVCDKRRKVNVVQVVAAERWWRWLDTKVPLCTGPLAQAAAAEGQTRTNTDLHSKLKPVGAAVLRVI